MTLKVDESSAEKVAALEEGCSVTAGTLDIETFNQKVDESRARQDHRESHLGIFSKLVELKRRDAGLSREALAEQANIEVVELFQIETNLDEAPEPRVVSRLAKALQLPAGKMMQLVGHLNVVDGNVSLAAQRFAASSGSMQALSADERKALSEFVDALARD
jgi:transcriptional regulator with XRE-family HTH domain